MKRHLFAATLISAMLAGAAGSAFASDAYPEGSQFAWVPQSSAMSRDQVKADLAQAQAHGLLAQNDYDYPKAVDQGLGITREQVKAELAQAAAQGLLAQGDVAYPRVAAAPVTSVAQLSQGLTIASADTSSISPQP